MPAELSNIFNGGQKAPTQSAKPEATPKVEAAPKPEPQNPVEKAETPAPDAGAPTPDPDKGGQKRDENGRFVPLEALQENRGKLKDEKKKSRDLEAELTQLREKMAALENRAPSPNPQQPPEKPEKAYWRDPPGYVNNAITQQKLEMSEVMARYAHPDDFDEAFEAFKDAAQNAPHLIAQMRQHPHPGEFVYQAGKTYLKAKQVGNIDEFEKKVREDEREKVVAELQKKQAVEDASKIPKSVGAGARGTGVDQKPVFAGPSKLSSVFPGY